MLTPITHGAKVFAKVVIFSKAAMRLSEIFEITLD